jgi:hypothetical protein
MGCSQSSETAQMFGVSPLKMGALNANAFPGPQTASFIYELFMLGLDDYPARWSFGLSVNENLRKTT